MGRNLTVQSFCGEREREALAYLAARPVTTVYMRSLIRDHGLCSPENRGDFFACFDEGGTVRGIALLGHATLIEADDDPVIEAFARFALTRPCPRLIRGERRTIDRFRRSYMSGGDVPHLVNNEMLLIQRRWAADVAPVPDLRLATPDDLSLLAEVNAGLIEDEGGVNPLKHDPAGFKRRLLDRIERGRVWLWRESGRLIFKTDVLADTPESIYIEGVYVAPQERGRGFGVPCLTQLGRLLLERAGSVCLTVNESNHAALSFYLKAGYEPHSEYATVYLNPVERVAAA